VQNGERSFGDSRFRHLQPTLRFRRDQEGRIVKEFDHLMDAFRYLVMSGRDRMKTKQPPRREPTLIYEYPQRDSLRWMQ
jgi:hypothetical protein